MDRLTERQAELVRGVVERWVTNVREASADILEGVHRPASDWDFKELEELGFVLYSDAHTVYRELEWARNNVGCFGQPGYIDDKEA